MAVIDRTIPRPSLWSVVWPVVAMGWLRQGYLLTDSWFVGRLGDDALAAIGGSAFAWWMLLLLAELPGVGVHALVAQHVGAERLDLVRGTFTQGLWLGIALGVGLLALLPAVPWYLAAVGFAAGSHTAALGTAFLSASLQGGVPVVLNVVVGGVFRGLGRTRAALGITVLTFVVNAALLPVLIRPLGIAGAAWATVLASAVGACIGLGWLTVRGLGPTRAQPHAASIARIAAIGGPVSARGIAFCFVYVLLGRFIVQFGEAQMAGLGIGHRVEGLAYQVCVAFEVGAATLVGQHVGARDLVGARRAAHQAALLCSALMIPAALILFVAAPAIFDAFASTEATIGAGTAYLRIQTAVFVFMALEAVYGGAFAGSGRTVAPFWIVTIGTVARLPLAWLLAWPLGLGARGIWIAIALSTMGKGIASASAWRRRWALPHPMAPQAPSR